MRANQIAEKRALCQCLFVSSRPAIIETRGAGTEYVHFPFCFLQVSNRITKNQPGFSFCHFKTVKQKWLRFSFFHFKVRNRKTKKSACLKNDFLRFFSFSALEILQNSQMDLLTYLFYFFMLNYRNNIGKVLTLFGLPSPPY